MEDAHVAMDDVRSALAAMHVAHSAAAADAAARGDDSEAAARCRRMAAAAAAAAGLVPPSPVLGTLLLRLLRFYGFSFDASKMEPAVAVGARQPRQRPTAAVTGGKKGSKRAQAAARAAELAASYGASVSVPDPLDPANNTSQSCFRFPEVQRALGHAYNGLLSLGAGLGADDGNGDGVTASGAAGDARASGGSAAAADGAAAPRRAMPALLASVIRDFPQEL
mmetsp:Transcript_16201/g.56585  ORF Transcript_16201/g.56585 Transcript_16201/m.56585 type:complete len:223 (-) Transcript_16201:92-760(-)